MGGISHIARLIYILAFWVSGALFGQTDPQDWRQLRRGALVFWCQSEDVGNADFVLDAAEAAEDKLAVVFKGRPAYETALIMAPSELDFTRLTGEQIPEWGVGAADPRRGVVILKSPRFARSRMRLENVIAHELSHVWLFRMLNGLEAPRWFDEGLAQWIAAENGLGSGILMARAFLFGHAVSLDEIEIVLSFRREMAQLAYEEARSAVAYMMHTGGEQAIRVFVSALTDGATPDEAIRMTTGLSLDAFETAWLKFVKRRYRWYIVMDFRFILSTVMVLLFLTAFLLAHRRAREKRRLWDEEPDNQFES